MSDKKNKSLIDEAILDVNSMKRILEANTKEILRTTMNEEINAMMKESLQEDVDYEEEDVVDDEPMDDASAETEEVVDEPTEEEPTSDDETEAGEQIELGDETEEVVDEPTEEMPELELTDEPSDDFDFDTMDLTTATDDEVISVFKKLNNEDEIEVVSDTEVNITDPDSGNEYNVKVGQSAPIEDLGIETAIDTGLDDIDENVVYEIDLNEMEDIGRDIKHTGKPRGQGHDKRDYVKDYTGPKPKKIDQAHVGEGDDFADGDNLEGGFDEEAPGKKGGHAEYVTSDVKDEKMGKKVPVVKENIDDDFTYDDLDDDTTFDLEMDDEMLNQGTRRPDRMDEPRIEDESDSEFIDWVRDSSPFTGDNVPGVGVEDDLDPIDEKIKIGKGMSVGAHSNKTTDIGQPLGPGAKDFRNESVKNEVIKRYNSLLTEVKNLKAEREQFKSNLRKFRDMLAETVIYNSNLTYVTKLMVEHSTTKEEKENIMKRFDGEVTSLKESKKLYKTIANELSSKKVIGESVINKTNDTQSTSVGKINETRTYVDESTKRINDLIKRVEGRE